jgi:protein-S-isoprenylcysteine O-methyltransferase Ste14
MWFVAHSDFAYPVSVRYPLLLALVLAVIGVISSVLAIRQFGVAETTINPLSPDSATTLVSTGIFRLSRNPMYVGLLFILAGWGVWLSSLVNIFVIVFFVLFITKLQIEPEEKALRLLFGQDYEEYCQHVRRWI